MDRISDKIHRQFGVIVGSAHAVIYIVFMGVLTNSTDDKPSFSSHSLYTMLVILRVAEATASVLLIKAILFRNAAYMRPWMIITPITVFVISVSVDERDVMKTLLIIFSAISMYIVYTLYHKQMNASNLPQDCGIAASDPNIPEIMATAPPPSQPPPRAPLPPISPSPSAPPQTYNQSIYHIPTATTNDADPPSYDTVMGFEAAPPYASAS